MFESLDELVDDGRVPGVDDVDDGRARTSSRAIGKGLLKTISKMGISTIQSYNGAQIFEAVGLAPRADRPLLHRHRVAHRRHRRSTCSRARRSTATRAAYPRTARATCCRSAASTRGAATASTTCGTRRRSRCCSTRSRHGGAADLRRVRASSSTRTPRAGRRCAGCSSSSCAEDERLPLDEVEPAKEIVKRFVDRRDVARLARRARRTRRWRSR